MKSILLVKKFLGLVEMTSGLVNRELKNHDEVHDDDVC